MKLKNDFSERTKEFFIWNTKCFYCGKEHANCFHHVLGRTSDSILNCCPIANFECHIGNPELFHFKTKKRLLHQILKYLLQDDYRLTKKDKEFMKKHQEYYIDFE